MQRRRAGCLSLIGIPTPARLSSLFMKPTKYYLWLESEDSNFRAKFCELDPELTKVILDQLFAQQPHGNSTGLRICGWDSEKFRRDDGDRIDPDEDLSIPPRPFDTGQKFDSIRDAAKQLGWPVQTLYNARANTENIKGSICFWCKGIQFEILS